MGFVGVLGLGGLLATSGCMPAVTASGLPKLGRYSSPAQLDWILGRYETIAQNPSSSDELREEACLGWERAVFDLQSGRRYPMLLRMSSDTINLANLWQDLPILARRHPRPSVCDAAPKVAAATPATVVAPGGSGQPPVASAEPMATPGEGGQAATSQGNTSAVGPVVAAAPTTAAQIQANVSPSAPPPVEPAAAAPESLVAKQRRQLARLRTTLGLSLEPRLGDGEWANPEAARIEPGPNLHPTPSPEIDDRTLQVLTELAESDIPPISLRARFHLLGLCVRAVEASDRYLFEPTATPASQKICDLRNPTENLRRGQHRRMWSLLKAWRRKYPEPMGDIVIGLASFASRDNPLVDGPRVSR